MDTPDPTASVPVDPASPTEASPTAPPPAASPTPPDAAGSGPVAPIALGPVSGGWLPPPPPPGPPPAPPNLGPGAPWGPFSTPYGLAWGPQPIPPAPTYHRHPRLIPLIGVAVVISLLVGVGVGYAVWQPAAKSTTSFSAPGGTSPGSGSFIPSGGGATTTPSGSGSSGTSVGASSVAAKVDPGLVDIDVTLSYEGESAAGTGQVLTSSGEVLTNNHVIDGATTIKATDIGNGQTYTASVVGYDRTGDLAVIQLHGASGLSTVSIGDSSKVAVGQSIVAIGNAGGVGGTPSVASGSVTSLNQAITASDDGGGNSEQLTGLIEVNADVQPGDSGGPLVNSSGQVVGIDTAAATDSFSSTGGDGYAIPINTAVTIARQIEAGHSSSTVHVGSTAFLGVRVAPSLADCGTTGGLGGGLGGLGNGGSSTTGATVCGAASGSPAAGAGLTEGDVITSVGGQAVTTPQSLSTIIAGHHPGDSLVVTWVDAEGASHSATVQLGSGPAT